ncbi:MAG: methionyl-tRNA formyltransferase, partial [Candidatus Peribacteraceae bacterium]|nr:methionyl-tRNA formyltransferase [Candidatus Peribacteraceae bacterium]
LSDPAFSVKLVITQPDKPVGRKQVLIPPPVKVLAGKRGIRVWQPQNINEEAKSYKLMATSCDFLVVVAYGQILSKEILALPHIAPVNLHPSLLPRWRGASPIHHALLARDKETGVTIQKMAEALDAGPILAQEHLPLSMTETYEHLRQVLAEKGAALLVRTLKSPLQPIPQDAGTVTVCSKLTRKDGEAAPSIMTAEEIDRKVRALTPWPGVTGAINNEMVKFLKTSLTQAPESLPLSCADGTTLFVTELQPPGKKPMSGAAWARGHGK